MRDAQPPAPTSPRPVTGIVPAVTTLEGAGFRVNRPFPTERMSMLDPFLLLDEMGPADLRPGEAKGAPDHPHRGFETVTYMLEGGMEHADSAGNRGYIGPGDVQWMTAGSGVVHSEMPSPAILRDGGRMHGFQLWVNLPADSKMIPPRYQEIGAEEIPTVQLPDGGSVRVVTGRFGSVTGAVETHSPVTYLHLTLPAEASLDVEPDEDIDAGVYVFGGAGTVGTPAAEVRQQQFALLGPGGHIRIAAGHEGLEALVLAGRPLRQPVARYGPFVMNTRDEIVEAMEDYRSGRMGRIA